MCLIINKPAKVEFTTPELTDFYARNRDGVGIMWTTKDGSVDVEKLPAPTLDEWLQFYDSYARGRRCAIHLRMRTHGDIDDENTHPYYVGRGFFLMHNGVLATGNANDESKSDTWHFIRDALRPAMKRYPKCFTDSTFIERLGGVIGRGNKFVVYGPSGTSAVVNRSSGVTYRGAWLSNTYAWSAPRSTRATGYLPAWA